MFYEKCRSLMLPREGYFVCRNEHCGSVVTIEGKATTSVEFERTEKKPTVIIEGEQAKTLPVAKVECPKCKHNEATWVLRQTRAADEPETRIYQCTECYHKWREY